MDNRLSIPSKLINLSELISATAVEKGRHYQSVYILEFSNSIKYVLKEKNVEDSGSLMDEAERLKWLNAIVPVPKVIGYLKENGKEQLVMTYIEGCQFNDNLPDKLINMVRKNIFERKHEVVDAINKLFPNHTIEQLMDFLEMYKASTEELVFTHGDYGSGNVMIHKGSIAAFIDVGASGISDPYYDIYYLVKSLTFYTDKEEEVEEFMKGYRISELDENRMKFHQIIDTLLL